jgi:uncharacterized protein (TIGR03083 family)
MVLPRVEVVTGMVDEYDAFTELVRGITLDDWAMPSRCQGWRVADVAGHVIGQLSDVVALRLDGLGTPEVTDRQVQQRRGRTPADLASELETGVTTATALAQAFDDNAWDSPAPGGTTGTLGFGIESLWFDTFLHADDITSAVGSPGRRRADSLKASISHIAQVLTDQGWGPATLCLEGMPEFAVSGGGGRIVNGDPMEFILAATGRTDPAPIGLDPTVNIYR